MKNKMKYLFIAALSFFCIGMVQAEETNLENIKLTVEGITDSDQTNAYISIKDVTFNTEHNFYYILTKDTTDIPENISSSDTDNYLGSYIQPDIPTIIYRDYLSATEQWGDIYVTIYETENNSDFVKKTDSLLVKRPDDLMLSKRVHAYFFDDSSTFLLYGLNNISTERKLNYKIGVVSDKSILNKIKNGNSIGLQELLNYSKNDSNIITSGSRNATSNQEPIFSQTDIVEGKYYYVYLELDTENGKYYPMEDISLYKALKNVKDKLWLADYTDDSFTWDDLEDKYQSYWEKFVKLFKENEFTTYFIDSNKEGLTIANDDNSLTITLKNEDNDYTTVFNYANGIVSFELIEGQEFFDSYWSSVALQTLAKMFNYDVDKMTSYLESKTDFDLAKDGIAFKLKDYNLNSNNENFNVNINGEVFENLQMDIVNGLKNFKVVDNPHVDEQANQVQTGVKIGIYAVCSLALLSLAGYLIYNKLSKQNRITKI